MTKVKYDSEKISVENLTVALIDAGYGGDASGWINNLRKGDTDMTEKADHISPEIQGRQSEGGKNELDD